MRKNLIVSIDALPAALRHRRIRRFVPTIDLNVSFGGPKPRRVMGKFA